MNRSHILIFLVFLAFVSPVYAQKKRSVSLKKNNIPTAGTKNSNAAVVIDERLAVLRVQPSLYSETVQRIRTGRVVAINGAKTVDGVMFFRVLITPKKSGWVQSDALIGVNRRADDERLFRLIQASDGFERFERAAVYLRNFPNSPLRPAVLLLVGDLAEELAAKLSRDVARQLDKREMSASGAPVHSFYLSHSSLDRYRKIGINFWFNPATKSFHYDGTTWREILAKFRPAQEASAAQSRLEALDEKMKRQ